MVAQFLTEEMQQLLRREKCKGMSEDHFALFLHAIDRYRLDPLANQIYAVPRTSYGKPTITIQTGIDGFRLIADRTGCYAGNDDPIHDNEEKPRKATVTVYKIVGGIRCPFTASARWDQYYPGDKVGAFWKKMPHLMLGKCAEALALRKAFPAELSGLYTTEEMAQANAPPVRESSKGKWGNGEPDKPKENDDMPQRIANAEAAIAAAKSDEDMQIIARRIAGANFPVGVQGKLAEAVTTRLDIINQNKSEEVQV